MHTTDAFSKPAPNMLEILLIIPSCISQNVTNYSFILVSLPIILVFPYCYFQTLPQSNHS